MKRTILSLLVLVSMLLGMAASASATPVITGRPAQQSDPLQNENVVVKLYYSNKAELDQLAGVYDILSVDTRLGYAVILLSPLEFSTLQQAGYQMEVDEAKTKLINHPAERLPGQGTDSIPGYPCYRTVEETYTTLEQIAADHPDMSLLIDIGDSWDKVTSGGLPGYDILALRLTNEDPQYGDPLAKPTFYLMAEIHAREYATAELATRYAEYLINGYGIDPDITWLLNYFSIYIVSMTNPDGRKIAEQGELWRKNVDNNDGCTDPYSWGTDLNRNYSFKWGCCGGSSGQPCAETYRGPTAASEPETGAVINFVLGLFDDNRGPGDTDPAPLDTSGLLLTLHSAASLVLWPWGWTGTDAPNAPQLQTLGRHLAYYNDYTPQQSNDLYVTDGTTDDWSYGELGLASFTFELAGDFFQPCGPFEATDVPDNINAIHYAFKATRRPYQNPAGPDSDNVVANPIAVTPGEPVFLTATANDTHYVGSGNSQNIAEAHYSIDDPSWVSGTLVYPMEASDGSFNSTVENIEATIDTTGLSSGKHMVFVESRDVGNNWGVIGAAFIYILEPGVSPTIEGYVREAGTNQPVEASVTAGLFSSTSDPSTGYYSMTVISGTYDMVATADNFAPGYANGVIANDYETVQQDFSLYPTCTIFTDDVENGNTIWTADPPWAITDESSHSSTHSWTDSPGGYYNNYADVSLTSSVLDLSQATGVTVNFWHTYATEPTFDFGYVEYNTGSGWNTAAAFDGYQMSWTQVELPIPALDQQGNARIRFHFTSDSYINDDGWHIDDISIVAGGPGCMPPAPPVAEFTSNSPVPLGQPVEFLNQTSGSEPMSYLWDFGDGIGTSMDSNPSYTYAEIGTYSVTLTATNDLGTDNIIHDVTVELAPITQVNLSLVNPGPIYPGDQVEFNIDLLPNTAAKPYTYTIDFGDGTLLSGSSDLDPLQLVYTYTLPGEYTVEFGAQNVVMSAPVTDQLLVTVDMTPTPPVADFASNSPVLLGQPIQFTNLTTGTLPITYNWDFGDGIGTSTEVNPVYTYSTAGIFTVELVATNDFGTDVITKTVTVVSQLFKNFLPITTK